MMPSFVHRIMQFKVTQWLRQLERALCHTLASHQCLYKYMDHKGSAAMLPIKRSAGVASEVNLRNPLYVGKKAHKKGIHPGFETLDKHHQKFKVGVSIKNKKIGASDKKGLMSSKLLFENR